MQATLWVIQWSSMIYALGLVAAKDQRIFAKQATSPAGYMPSIDQSMQVMRQTRVRTHLPKECRTECNHEEEPVGSR
jgi:hypothetical protein